MGSLDPLESVPNPLQPPLCSGALEVDLDDEQHLVVLAANGLEEAVVTVDVEEH